MEVKMISILLLFVISCNSPNETKRKTTVWKLQVKILFGKHTIKMMFYQFLPITDSTYKVEWEIEFLIMLVMKF